ncbi:MAG: toxin-antitoxin system HicB family antitoxin [Candidatus Sericytochromatia bacterium]|nr:toxin-antitoxin system HicB family antitoxin [Candidatus Sericytochromatia bacterium]
MKPADRYLKLVEWSDADGCYVGSVPGWLGACCHGDDEASVYQELCQIVAEWVDTLTREGQPLPPATAGKAYSGKFQLRLSSDLHQTLAIKALQQGESLNHLCVRLLKEAVQPSA